MRLNPVLAELGASPIATIQQRARALRDAGKKIVDFSIGDPRESTPFFIRHAVEEAVPEVSQYPLPGGTSELKSAIADYTARRFGVDVNPETQVVATSGSKEAIFNSPLAFIDSNAADAVVYPTPGYAIYERGARFAGAQVIPIRLGGDFVLRVDDIPESAWERARLVWVCSPHNPSGSVTSATELASLVERARASGTLLLSDECYTDVYEDEAFDEAPASVLEVAGPGSLGVLSFFSCSKRSGMTGYRSGAVVGDAEAVSALQKLRTATGTTSPDFVQAAASAAWSDDAHASERREIFAEKRKILRVAFEEAGLEIVASRAGLYLWVRVEDDLKATDCLLDEGIVVSPGRYFGAGGEGHLRLALVPTLEECEAAAAAVIEVLS